MKEILIDVTELVRHRLRTGIQRVEREILRNWPGPAALVPVAFDSEAGGFRTIPERILGEVLLGTVSDEAEDGASEAGVIRPGGKVLFNPELFHERARGEAYRGLVGSGECRVKWLVYDFLPWLRPEFFPRRTGRHIMSYIRALRVVPEVAFISEETRGDYQRAIMRSAERDGPVFALGGDGLELAGQEFDPARRSFVVLGRVMVRKNVGGILEAFGALWQRGVTAPLTVLGGVDQEAVRERQLLDELGSSPQFRLVEDPDDATVRAALGEARALVTASEAEGFGLPPLEALAAGIPVIAPAALPSIRLLPPLGQVRLARADKASIEAAVLRLTDDARAEELWAEAARVAVPTWKDFATSLAAWLQE